jgi:hypothetical protein
MNRLGCLLAQADGEVSRPWETLDPATREYLFVLGALTVVCLVVFGWAVLVRRRRRRRAHHHSRHPTRHASPSTASDATPAGGTPPGGVPETEGRPRPSLLERLFSRGHKHRRRHRRSRHRPMNPTLADTGGMPPARSEHTSDDFP